MAEEKVTALERISAGDRGLQLHSVSDMRTVSQIILQSKLAPDSYKTAEQIFVGLQTGAEIGLKPMQALNSIVVIHGRPTLWGDAALAMVRKSGLCSAFAESVEGDGDKMIAKCSSTRKDSAGEFTVSTEFTVQDAKTANLWGKAGPWKTHPKRMLKYKARSFNLRDNFSDVIMGMHITEEMQGEEPLPMAKSDVQHRDERRKPVMDAQVIEQPEPIVTDGNGSGDITYEDVKYAFEAKEPKGEFAQWAAYILMCEEDEVDAPEKFNQQMLEALKRELEQKGVTK